jgi:hypothetical protein
MELEKTHKPPAMTHVKAMGNKIHHIMKRAQRVEADIRAKRALIGDLALV